MTTVSPNTNSLASLFNERAKNIIKNVGKINQELAKEKFMVQKEDTQGKGGSIQSNSQPRPTTAEPNKTGLDLSEVARYAIPPLLNGILGPGEMSRRTEADGTKLAIIVHQYFDTLKEEFGCTTKDYMPYMPGVPEYDPKIENEMKGALYEMVLSNPECERLTRSKGGIWPPPQPEEFDPWTMCYGPGWGGGLRIWDLSRI